MIFKAYDAQKMHDEVAEVQFNSSLEWPRRSAREAANSAGFVGVCRLGRSVIVRSVRGA